MVALNETDSELGLRRAARGCRVTATYPQGGTGIAAGGVNFPGAAARTIFLGTGFRAVDGPNNFGLPPNALNINGANTYQFVGGDPVGMVDASGQSATIEFQLGSPTQGLPLAYPTPESVPIASTPGMPSLGVSPLTGFNPPPVPNGPPGVAFLNGYDPTPAGVGVGLGGVSIGDLAGAQLHNLELQQTLAGQPPWGDVWEGRLGTWPNSPVSWDNGGGEPSTGAYLNGLLIADGLIGDLGEALGGLAGDGLRALRGLLDDGLPRPPCPDTAGSAAASQPLPPGWNKNWEWGPPSGRADGSNRWFYEDGGEWRYHDVDPWHDTPHWDYNPWDQWNSPWQNVPVPSTPPPTGAP